MFQFNSGLHFTTKMPYQFARAHVHDAPHHPVSFTIDLHSWSLIGVPISTSLAQSRYLEIRRLPTCNTTTPKVVHHQIALEAGIAKHCLGFKIVDRYTCL